MRLGIIGGTGATALLPELSVATPFDPGDLPFGPPSHPPQRFRWGGHELVFLARHGLPRQIAAHAVNYRANVWAMRELNVDRVLAVNTVGGIGKDAAPGSLLVPDQLIDYTWGRQHTYVGDGLRGLRHVEFTEPFSAPDRQAWMDAAARAGVPVIAGGCYGVTQGPRLETAAEIQRLRQDGCSVVGMTAMPEAGLARELDLPYFLCAVVVNYAAGMAPATGPVLPGIHAQIAASLESGMAKVRAILTAYLQF